jgi:hypothetical protein
VLIAGALARHRARASAQTEIAFVYDENADPELHAEARGSSGQNGTRVVEWRACPPDVSACTPLRVSAYEGQQRCPVPVARCSLSARPGPTAPGTVLEAAFERDGTISTRRTSSWRGRPASSGAPAVPEAVVGRPVPVHGGMWTGGWVPAPEYFT